MRAENVQYSYFEIRKAVAGQKVTEHKSGRHYLRAPPAAAPAIAASLFGHRTLDCFWVDTAFT